MEEGKESPGRTMNVIKRYEDVLSKRPGCEKKLHNVKGAERWWNKTEKVRWGHAVEGLACHANYPTFIWWAKRPGFKSMSGKWPDYKPIFKNNSIQGHPRRVYSTNTEYRLCTKQHGAEQIKIPPLNRGKNKK